MCVTTNMAWSWPHCRPPCRARVPVVAWNAHLDTSPETSGANVRPQIIRDYAGGDIVLPGDPSQVIRVADNPELEQLHGATLITSDGTTLLGADDKAGIAVIMEAATYLQEHPEVPHGPLRILFTCDEEIGHGVDHVDLQQLGAHVCYTLDGRRSQHDRRRDVLGRSGHRHGPRRQHSPVDCQGSHGQCLAGRRALPQPPSPRHRWPRKSSDGRQGFLHPYVIQGGVAEVTIKILLRDFTTSTLADHAQLLRTPRPCRGAGDRRASKSTSRCRPQYRNMAEGLQREPRAVAFAQEAHTRLGTNRPTDHHPRRHRRVHARPPRDLPTPNLSSGQHTPHSPLEWACLDEMVLAAEVLVETARVWCEKGAWLEHAPSTGQIQEDACTAELPNLRDSSPSCDRKIDLWWLR